MKLLEGFGHKTKDLALKAFQNSIPNFSEIKYKIANMIEKSKHLKKSNLELGIKHINSGRIYDAKFRFRLMILLQPHYVEALYHLGRCYELEFDFPAAASYYQKVLNIEPNNVKAKFRLDNVNGKIITSFLPEIVAEDFDYFASQTYDNALVFDYYNQLDFLLKRLESFTGVNKTFKKVLDLGCGKGAILELVNEKFKVENITGVDISFKMLEKSAVAGSKKLKYNSLIHDSIKDYLINSKNEEFDLVVAANSLSFISEPDKLFENIYKCLIKEGYFVAIVTKLEEFSNSINKNDFCYSAHAGYNVYSNVYLKDISKKAGFEVLEVSEIIIEQEPHPCWLLICKKNF